MRAALELVGLEAKGKRLQPDGSDVPAVGELLGDYLTALAGANPAPLAAAVAAQARAASERALADRSRREDEVRP